MTSAEKRYRTELNLWDKTLDGFADSDYSVPIFPRKKLILKKDGKKLLKHKITDPKGLFDEYKRRQVQYFKIMLDPDMEPFGLGEPVSDALHDTELPNSVFPPSPDVLPDTDSNVTDASNLDTSDFSDIHNPFSVEESSRNDTESSSWQDLYSSSNDDDDDDYEDDFQNLWRPPQSEVEPRDHHLKKKYVKDKDKEKQQAIRYFGDEFLYTPDLDMEPGIVVERIGKTYYYLYKTSEEDWRLEYAQPLTTRV